MDEIAVDIWRNRLDCDATAFVNLRACMTEETWEKWLAVWEMATEGVENV